MLRRPNSTVSIRNKNHKYNYLRNNTANNIFNQNNNNICQSPKIYSGKMRYILEDKKLFSLLDINEKITNSKGPSLPIQFKRLTTSQIHDLLNGNFFRNQEKQKKIKCSLLKKNLYKRLKIPKEIKDDINNELKSKNIKSENNAFDESKNDTENNIQKRIVHTEQGLQIKKPDKKDEILKRPKTSKFSYQNSMNNLIKKKNSNFDIFENSKENNNIKKDIWLPTNYKNYEQIVKDRKLFIQKMNQNPFFNRLPSCTLKEIQSKVNNTDIFFINPPRPQAKFNAYANYKNNLKNINNCYYNSDIFNVKNDDTSLKKIGEKYLFNDLENLKYTTSRESKSEWQGHIDKNSINNCSSENYNIVMPNRKNNNLTKEKIYSTLDEKNNNKHNPLYKPKSVSKYIDLANNSSSNFGKDYMNCYNSSINCFRRVPEHCSSFGDLFLQYKNICDRPFYKKPIYIQ